jgi:hypothetical protein
MLTKGTQKIETGNRLKLTYFEGLALAFQVLQKCSCCSRPDYTVCLRKANSFCDFFAVVVIFTFIEVVQTTLAIFVMPTYCTQL